MKRIAAVLCLIATMALSACLRDNGNIGDWFGTWHLESMDVDGEVDADYNGDILWKFQNNIIMISQVNDLLHTSTDSFGTWIEDDGRLLLNFTYSDDYNPGGGTGIYAPPASIYLKPGISEMEIKELTSGKLILVYQASNDVVITYFFKKWS